MIVGFSLAELGGTFGIAPLSAQLVGSPSKNLDAWIAIATDGSVTAYTGKCEIGQGLFAMKIPGPPRSLQTITPHHFERALAQGGAIR